jgi:hypothetical protein
VTIVTINESGSTSHMDRIDPLEEGCNHAIYLLRSENKAIHNNLENIVLENPWSLFGDGDDQLAEKRIGPGKPRSSEF